MANQGACMQPLKCLNESNRAVKGLDIWKIDGFAQSQLGIDDPATFLGKLEKKYPARGEGDAIEPFEVQWVHGDNKALKYRGNVLRRDKMWLQKGETGDPEVDGIYRYGYTGWQWNVTPATADVSQLPEAKAVADKYDEWVDAHAYPVIGWLNERMPEMLDDRFRHKLAAFVIALQASNQNASQLLQALGARSVHRYPRANHYIFTSYKDGSHNIGFHFDKARDIVPESLITIVKLGEVGRRFQIRLRAFKKEGQSAKDHQKAQEAAPLIFDEVLPPGTALAMTLEANLLTQHGVPEDKDCVSVSGSMVFRTIGTRISAAAVRKELEKRNNKRKREEGGE